MSKIDRLSRKDFLILLGVGGSALAAASCGYKHTPSDPEIKPTANNRPPEIPVSRPSATPHAAAKVDASPFPPPKQEVTPVVNYEEWVQMEGLHFQKKDWTLWIGTDCEQEFKINPEKAGEIRDSILKTVWVASRVYGESSGNKNKFKENYPTYESFKDAVTEKTRKGETWDDLAIFLPSLDSITTRAMGDVTPKKIEEKVSLDNVRLVFRDPKEVNDLIEKENGFTYIYAGFLARMSTDKKPDGTAEIVMEISHWQLDDSLSDKITAIKPGSSDNILMVQGALEALRLTGSWVAQNEENRKYPPQVLKGQSTFLLRKPLNKPRPTSSYKNLNYLIIT